MSDDLNKPIKHDGKLYRRVENGKYEIWEEDFDTVWRMLQSYNDDIKDLSWIKRILDYFDPTGLYGCRGHFLIARSKGEYYRWVPVTEGFYHNGN